MRYLTGIKSLFICYENKVFKTELPPDLLIKGFKTLKLQGFNNSDFAGARENSKSIYGYLFTILGGLITWKCKEISIIILNPP